MAIVAAFREKLGQCQVHRTGNFRQRIQRRNGMAVLDARQVTPQQAGALFNVALRHASLKSKVANGLADIHNYATCSIPGADARLPATAPSATIECHYKDSCIVTRLVPSG